MKIRSVVQYLFATVVFGLVTGAQALAATFITIDAPGGAYNTFALGINSKGTIVGYYDAQTYFWQQGFVRDKYGNVTTFDIPGAFATAAFGINDKGSTLGSYLDNTDPYGYGFVRQRSGKVTKIDIPDSVYGTTAFGISSKGIVVGVYYDASIHAHGFVFGEKGKHNVTMIDFPGAVSTYLTGIDPVGNNLVGFYSDEHTVRGFVRDRYGAFTAFTYPDAVLTYASGINSAGSIVGYYYEGTSPWRQHGFVRDSGGTFTNIDFPGANVTYPNAIDSEGNIVGYYYDDTPPYHHGFLMTP